MSTQKCLCLCSCSCSCLCLLFAALIFAVGLGNGKTLSGAVNSPSPLPTQTIVVDASGGGNYKTVQSAIDSIPANNSKWICIYVKGGLYREKVTISWEKEFIYIKGQGKKETNIVWDDHSSIENSPTLTVMANNFFARSISFANLYNLPPLTNGNPRAPAVAALIGGDRCSFYLVGFYGLQDTLWDFKGRHYFKACTIVGAVDFIFGNGQSIYEGCTLGVTGAALGPGRVGYITAQGRESPQENTGFVFKDCSVTGDGLVYLGRAWRPYSRVVFYNTTLSNIVVPPGWSAWNYGGYEGQITFAEEGNTGPGANQTGRVQWANKLNQAQLNQLTSPSFVDYGDKWLQLQPDGGVLNK